ncbi:autotransporter outer membrane beta-barrel domain-containing protein [Pseudomonas sp. F1_0610]|uniref:autotransporter outer membrane beta-barrel domain-containing protein n=1 Tax=Pseudomonas sp. F1_0610 TaxID=3114284 RepID=UPI0039C25070
MRFWITQPLFFYSLTYFTSIPSLANPLSIEDIFISDAEISSLQEDDEGRYFITAKDKNGVLHKENVRLNFDFEKNNKNEKQVTVIGRNLLQDDSNYLNAENIEITVNNGLFSSITGQFHDDDSHSTNAKEKITASTKIVFNNGQADSIQGIESFVTDTKNQTINSNIIVTGGNIDSIQGITVYNDNLINFQEASLKSGISINGGEVGLIKGVIYNGENAPAKVNIESNIAINNATINQNEIILINFSGNQNTSSTLKAKLSIFGDSNIPDGIYISAVEQSTPTSSTAENINPFSGNLFNFGSKPISASIISNFENYHFYINEYNKDQVNKDTALIKSDIIINNPTQMNNGSLSNKSIAQIKGISGENIINVNDSITLISANSTQGGDENGDLASIFNLENNSVKFGLGKVAEVSYTIENKDLIATIDNIYSDNKAIELSVKPLAEGRLTQLISINKASDLMVSDVWKQIDKSPEDKTSSFIIIETSNDRFKTGSHIDHNGYTALIGAAYKTQNTTLGALLEYGDGDYDTYNKFTMGNIHGETKTTHYGFGLLAKHDLDNLWLEGALRIGRVRAKFKSNDIITGSGQSAAYDNRTTYVSSHAGIGHKYPINTQNTLETSLKYLYTHLNEESVIIDGDKVSFDSLTSSRVQLKEEWKYQPKSNLSLSAGLAYEYEFNGKADTSIYGKNIKAPSLKGSTGIIELGLQYSPFNNLNNKYFDVKLKGYTGQHRGVAGTLSFNYLF